MKLNTRTIKVWNKAKSCHCNIKDCKSNHKLCAICKQTMIYTAHESNQPTSEYAWNLDHINPASTSFTGQIINNQENLQAVHVSCNRRKADNSLKNPWDSFF